MAVSAEAAIRAWINAKPSLVGDGMPLSRGAYEGREIRSPAHGAYALLIRETGMTGQLCAEPGSPMRVRITAHVYAGTVHAAEQAAVALANAWLGLTGQPEPCGDTGVLVLVSDNVTDPGYVPAPAAGGEQFEFQTSAEFILAQT